MQSIIPKDIQREIDLILRGVKHKQRVPKVPLYSREELHSMAIKNLNFLNKVADTNPMSELLRDTEREVVVLRNFSAYYHSDAGMLVLKNIKGQGALYYWEDADYPVNRSDDDYTLVTEKEIEDWHRDSIKRFGLLTKKEIWKNIKKWLRSWRETM